MLQATAARIAVPVHMDERDLARLLGVSVSLIRKWRSQGGGPAYAKLGRRVVYDTNTVSEWLATKQVAA